MSENNQNPTPTPPNGGQPVGQATPANNTPAAPGNGQPDGGQKIEMSVAEVEALKRDAGRWKAHQKDTRENRRGNRTPSGQNGYQLPDGTDPEILEALRTRDTKLDELSLVNRELLVKDKVRDLFESDDYKDLPVSVKKAIIKNPLGFVNRNSETIDDAIADIQDYLDDELDARPAPQPAPDNNQPPTHQIPPAAGSAPASPNATANADVTGKTGPARSTAVLGNLFKKQRGQA